MITRALLVITVLFHLGGNIGRAREMTLNISDIVTNDGGGSFRISADQQTGNNIGAIGTYTIVLGVDGFDGGLSLEWNNLVTGMNQMGPEFGAAPARIQLGNGDLFMMGGFGSNGSVPFQEQHTDLVQVDFSFDSGWSLGDSFSASILDVDPDDPFFSFTFVGDNLGAIPLGLSQTTIVYAPECDVNRDSVCDATDIDELSALIRNEGAYAASFDLNRDSRVDRLDRETLINVSLNTHLGDSNLDGEFNSSDLVEIFRAGEYEDEVDLNSRWATGDWNGDAEFDSSDFVAAFTAAGYEQGPRALVRSVPEPSSLILVLGAVLAFGRVKLRHLPKK